MSILIAFGFWILGLVVGAFGLIQTLICVRVGYSITNALAGINVLQADTAARIKSRTTRTIILLVLGAIIVSTLVLVFAPSTSIWGYCIGVGFSFLLGVGKTDINHNNTMDYLSTYSRYMTVGDKMGIASHFNSPDVNTALGMQALNVIYGREGK